MRSLIGGIFGADKGAAPKRRRVMAAKPRPLGEAVARGLPALGQLGWKGKTMLGVGGVLLAATGFLYVTGGLGALQAAAGDEISRFTRAQGFVVDSVTVSGRGVVKGEDILAALGVSRGDDILGVDLAAARERLMELSWVQSASVERHLPDAIHVVLVERRPMALWQTNGKMHLVDQNGIAIEGEERQLSSYGNLPLIVGDDAPRHAAELIDLLGREPSIGARVEAAIRVSRRRWNLKLDNGVEIRLPEEGMEVAFDRLARLERTERLLSRDIVVVDLRQPDRLLVRLSDGAVERMNVPPAKNT